jgi:hypothetical protein
MGLVKREAQLEEARSDVEKALSLEPRNSEVLGQRPARWPSLPRARNGE